MILAMMFYKSIVEMVIVDLEVLDFAKMGAIGWIVSVLATTAIGAVDLLR